MKSFNVVVVAMEVDAEAFALDVVDVPIVVVVVESPSADTEGIGAVPRNTSKIGCDAGASRMRTLIAPTMAPEATGV